MRIHSIEFQLGRARLDTLRLLDTAYESSDEETETEQTPQIRSSILVRYQEYIDNNCEHGPRSDADVNEHFGLFVWPCARLLSQYIAYHNVSLLQDKIVLELGCGPAMPGIVAAICGNPRHVYLTDSSTNTIIRSNVQANIDLNNVQEKASYFSLDWGLASIQTLHHQLYPHEPPDIVLAADCCYQPQSFDKVLMTIVYIFDRNPKSKCLLCYQLRDVNDSIAILLTEYKIAWKLLDTRSFRNEYERYGHCASDIDSLFLYELQPAT